MTKTFSLALILAAALLPPAAARAAPATPDGADKLKATFERYLGAPAAGETGSVSVTTEGSAYRVTLDIKRLTRPLEGFGVSVEPVSSTLVLTPNDDGTWKVSSDAIPPMTIHVKDQTIATTSGPYKFEGTFDPALMTFSTASGVQDGATFDQDTPAMSQHRRIGQVRINQKSAPAANGAASLDLTYAMTDVTDAMTMRPPKPAASVAVAPTPPPITFSYTLPSAVVSLSTGGMRMKSLLDLWAFLVAHPNQDSLTAAQEELRTLLRGALPLLAGLKETAALDSFALSTDLGPFSARKITSDLALDGLAGSGTMTFGLGLDDVKLPPLNLPEWSAGLIPTAVSVKPTLTGFHFDETLRELVNTFDLKRPDGFTPADKDRIVHLLWPGDGKVTLAPSRITSPLMDLRFDGEATLGAAPVGRLNLSATGLDKAIASLQKATADETAAQVLAQLIFAKNLAKAGPDDSLVWVLEASPGAPPTVNGVPLK